MTILNIKNDLKETSIKIYNILGKKVLGKKNLTSNIIDVSHIENGVYLLKVQKENLYKTIKLIKQ